MTCFKLPKKSATFIFNPLASMLKTLFRHVYGQIPGKRYVFDLLKAYSRPPFWLYQHLLFSEPFKIDIGNEVSFLLFNKSAIENDIYWNGFMKSWEKTSLAAWIQICMKEGPGSIIDVGANSGIYSLVAASVSPLTDVYAFEPHPMFFQWLKDNIIINNLRLHSIHAFQVALGDSDGSAQIADYSRADSLIEAQILTFDSFARQQRLGPIKAIKVDIEGMEPEFIKGAYKSIKKFLPFILIEVLTSEIGLQIMHNLKDLSYDVFHINDDTGNIQRVALPEPRSSGRNFLLIPQMQS